MKITFVEPPPITEKIPERLAGCSYELYHFPDLANLILGSCMENDGFEVEYVDCNMEKWQEEKFYEYIRDDKSDYYITHSVILSKKTDLAFAKKLFEIKMTNLIFYGPEPTRVPGEYLINSNIVVVRGEPEENLINFIKNKESKGISYIKDGLFYEEPPSGRLLDLDSLPIPNRTSGRLKRYKDLYFNPKFKKKPFTVLMASRGCSFNCRFCVPNSISFARELEYRRFFQKKPPPSIASSHRVIQEFKKIKEDGFNSVLAIDDEFLWGKKRTLEICDGIKDFGIEWGCLARADFLTDEEVVKALSQANCTTIDIGVESFCQKILDYGRKNLKVQTVYQAIELLKTYRIKPKINIIFGISPYETEEDAKKTIKELAKINIGEVMFSIATPFKGTGFYDECLSAGYLIDTSDEIDPLHKAIVCYSCLSNRDLERIKKYAYRKYYLRPGYILNRIKNYSSFFDLIKDIKIGLKLFKRE